MKRLLALLLMAPLGLTATACGRAGQATNSSSTATSAGGATSGTTSTSGPSGGESKLDLDKDNDNPTGSYYDDDDEPILHDQATSTAEGREVAAMIRRYYKAGVAHDGATACSLLYSAIAESIPEEYGEAATFPALHGTTCAVVMSKLLRQRHRQLASELSGLEVTGARVEGSRGWALLGFGPSKPPGRILLQREGTVWRIAELWRTEMP